MIDFLDLEYRGKGKKFHEAVFDRVQNRQNLLKKQRNFIKEKYKSLQEPEDIAYYLGYYEDDKDPKKKALAGSVPQKKVQTENSALNAARMGPYASGNQFANE